MARTGFKIIEDVYQFFNNGPISGSVVSSSYAVDLTVSPYSASLNEEEYFNRSLDPLSCTKEVNGCLSPLLTSLNTGSQRGYFDLYYTKVKSDGHIMFHDYGDSMWTGIKMFCDEKCNQGIMKLKATSERIAVFKLC